MTSRHAGSSWRERRESMGKTIGQVSADLRIGQRYLSGIEEGDFGEFPERVFSTGFIRSYAKYLSQDPGPVLAMYERSIGIRDDSDTAAQLRFGWVERERER
ncbi:MAG TPA: helix-turn-helix domain-containing protein, partial [Candidatus Deferrimicrobium sp.]